MEGVPSELALGSALLAALGAVVYWSWSGPETSGNTAGGSGARSSVDTIGRGRANTKRGKRKRTADIPTLIASNDEGESNAEKSGLSKTKPSTAVQKSETLTIPGGLAPLLSASEAEHSAASSSASKSKKKKKGKKGDTPTASLTLPPPTAPGPSKNKKSLHKQEVSGTSELDSESGWTQVNRGRGSNAQGGETASDTGMTTSHTEEEGSVASKREETLTSAEKLLPKAPKTAVDDMIDGAKPGIARVMRIPGSSTAQPATGSTSNFKPPEGYSLDDYEDSEDIKGSGVDADEEDSNWNVVSWKKRGGTNTPSAYASDAPPSTATLSSSSQSALTKKQRQNAAKRDANKERKEAAEKERLATLAKHKRELERARIDEQFKGKGKSGGMTAKVDSSGGLVWE